MFAVLRHFRRIITVSRILARHDTLFPLERAGVPGAVVSLLRIILLAPRKSEVQKMRPGKRLTIALTALGPAYVKLGQALSVRPDLVGDTLADDLTSLQDDLPAFSGADARAAIEAELNGTVDELFGSFDDTAIAAASIAQVHKATNPEGHPIAVKVLRPGIEAAFARDLDVALWGAGQLEKLRPDMCRLRPVEAVRTIIRSVEIEMDLRFEAAAADELRQNFEDDPTFSVPAVDWQRTGRRVMTTAWIDATPMNEIDADSDKFNRENIVASFARAFFLQVFRDGFFHADLHPGNIFVDAGGVVHAVDFGIMGRLDRQTRQYLAEMLHGFLTGNYKRVADIHIQAGYVPADQSADEFAQAARSIAEPILGLPLSEISLARLLAQLFAIAEKFEMRAQPQLLLLQKTMLVAEGSGRHLYPDINMWELARPLIEEWMMENMGPEARMREATEDLLDRLERLPQLIADMEGSISAITRDGLRVNPASLESLTGAQARRGTWRIWAVAAATGALVLVALD